MKKLKLHTVITILVVVLLSTTISFGQEVSPMGVVNVWRFVKSTEVPAIDYSLASPISAWITGLGSISSSKSSTFTASFSPVNITAELKSMIKASVNVTVSTSTTSTIGYTLTESGTRKVRMWYAPEIVTVKGTAQLWATPGGLVQSFPVTSKYERPMYYYALKITADPYMAEDVVQDAFCKMTKYIESINYEDDREIKSYLLAVIKTCAADNIRKNKIRETVTNPLEENVLYIEDNLDSDFDIDKAIGEVTFDGSIGELVSMLNEEDQNILYL